MRKRAARLGLAGLALGGIGAYLIWRVLGAQVPGLSRMEPAFVAIAAAILFTISLVSAVLPAMRAAQADPAITLRSA